MILLRIVSCCLCSVVSQLALDSGEVGAVTEEWWPGLGASSASVIRQPRLVTALVQSQASTEAG